MKAASADSAGYEILRALSLSIQCLWGAWIINARDGLSLTGEVVAVQWYRNQKDQLADDSDVFRLRAFGAGGYVKFDFLILFEGSITAGIDDVSEVNKNVGAGLLLNKAEAFVGIKPFNGAGSNCRHSNESCKIF